METKHFVTAHGLAVATGRHPNAIARLLTAGVLQPDAFVLGHDGEPARPLFRPDRAAIVIATTTIRHDRR